MLDRLHRSRRETRRRAQIFRVDPEEGLCSVWYKDEEDDAEGEMLYMFYMRRVCGRNVTLMLLLLAACHMYELY